MFRNAHPGLFREAAGAPAGSPAPAGGAPAPGGSPAPAPVPTPGGAPAPAPAHDWKAAGVEDADMALVTDRGWKNTGEVVKSYRNLEKLTGVPPDQIVKLPKDMTDAAAWREVHTKMGCPAKPDGYGLPKREGDTTGDFEKLVGPWFHEAGVSRSAAHAITANWNKYLDTTMKANAEKAKITQEQEMTALKGSGEWGDKFEANSAAVDRAADAFGMTADHLNKLKSVMGYSATMKFLYNIGSKVAVEGAGLIGSGAPAGFGALSPEQARAEIDRLRADRNWAAQFNSADPKMKAEARDKMRRLEAMAYPGTATL